MSEPAIQLHSNKIRGDLNDGTLDGYQDKANLTAIYPNQYTFSGLVYCSLKLNGEAGEVAEKVGKLMRDNRLRPTDTLLEIPGDKRDALAFELGDCLWYIANIANELGYALSEIADMNLEKLQKKQEKGTLSGSGDNR